MSTETTLYAAMGGDTTVRALVAAFYARMQQPGFEDLLALHPDLAKAEDRLYKYLTGWTGGPPLFVQEFGHPMLRARHLHVRVSARGRDQWLACMREALDETIPSAEVRSFFYQELSPLADHMRNQAEG